MIQILLILAGWYAARLVIAESLYYTPRAMARASFILAMIAFDFIVVGIAYYFGWSFANYIACFAVGKAVTVCWMDYNHLLYLDLNES